MGYEIRSRVARWYTYVFSCPSPYLGIFWRAFEWEILEYFKAFLYLTW
jgi:hypothetical protein